MPQNCRTRWGWMLTLLLIVSAAGFACGQTTIDNAEIASSPISALDLPAAAASQLTQALAAHNYTAAETLLLHEINQDPHSLRAGRLLSFAGRVYFLNADYLNAAIAWNKSDAIAPLDPSARFSLAMVYIKMGRSAWAEPLLQTLATDHPKQALYPYWLGRLDYDAQHYDAAIAHFQQALALDSKMARAYDNLGLCYFYQNHNVLAIDSYTKAIQLDAASPHPSAWPHLNLAIALQFLNRLDESEVQLHEALTLDPELAQAQYQLGLVLESRGHLEPAVSALKEASRLNATYAEPHYALARIYRKLGRKSLSQAEVTSYLRLHSDAKPAVALPKH
jgi:tetratricopeptide (TPR) repeat protein